MVSYPKISIVMPTRNAGKIIGNCLASLCQQSYPRECYEILVVDGHSTDDTRKVAESYGAKVFDDKGWSLEDAKRQALEQATGDYVLFLDADNELAHSDYLELAVRALENHQEAFGVEAYYFDSPKMTSLCAYLTQLLHISDPMCWIMSVKPVFLGKEGEVERWTMPQGSLAYPLGSNGFLCRRKDLVQVKAEQLFSDTQVAMLLFQSGKRSWLRIQGRGVHHYYAMTLYEFWRKRVRATCNFFKIFKQFRFSWTEKKPRVPSWLGCLYCLTVIGPVFHAWQGWRKTKDLRWWWHPLASWVSLAGLLYGVLLHWMQGEKEDLVASWQPVQSLEKK
ncbi:MAG: glycosyltransferase family 2 protein [Verrucomicrobiae bacterium]|nr:glycosyltransferase family 2 protein [Verrucomicrobiae bacterium]